MLLFLVFDEEDEDDDDSEMISQLEVTAALQAKLGLEGELGLAGGTLRFQVLLLNATFTSITNLINYVNQNDNQEPPIPK